MPHSKQIIQNISDVLDEGIIKVNKERKKRTYLGGSSLGESCSRKIQYRYLGVESDEGRDLLKYCGVRVTNKNVITV